MCCSSLFAVPPQCEESCKHLSRSKMRLFASFDGEITKQNGVLAEREKMLEGVKDQLIKESGNVLGGGSGGRY